MPAADWAAENRIHQYQGAHNDKYGGVTLNVDSDYLDGATADTENTGSAIPDGTFVRVDRYGRRSTGSPATRRCT